MNQSLIDQLRAARKVSTPLLAITTADPPATVAGILRAFNGDAKAPPVLQHDIIRGVVGLTASGVEARAELVPADDVMGSSEGPVLQSPAEALAAAVRLPKRSLLFVLNANELLQNAAVVQATCNLRDAFKADGRTLVLLDVAITLPAQLAQDVLILDEPLPSDTQIRGIIDQEIQNAQATMKPPPPTPDEPTIARGVAALAGLAAFPIEQAIAISLLSGALDPDQLWGRKRTLINQTKGLTMDAGSLVFDQLGGLAEIKRHGADIYGGPEPPAVIVRIDEIEKMMAGSGADSSGTSQDQKGVILREMEDMQWTGFIAVGPPGSGKTAICQAIGNTFGAPTFSFDLGAAKDKFVGGSEQLIRACLKVIKAIAGQRAYFVATCNNIQAGVITPDLLRRFTDGIWYFDLCSDEEKAKIWPIHLARYGHALDSARPRDTDWTGAEIRNCCRLAYRRRCSLLDAAKSIVPVAVSSMAEIDRLRTAAHGKFLSASYPGTYRHAKAPNVPAAGVAPSIGTGRSYAGEN